MVRCGRPDLRGQPESVLDHQPRAYRLSVTSGNMFLFGRVDLRFRVHCFERPVDFGRGRGAAYLHCWILMIRALLEISGARICILAGQTASCYLDPRAHFTP